MLMALPQATDDDLLAATARGEDEAFTLLVTRHSERLRRFAHRLTGNRADADDLVQEAFTRAYAQAPRWRQEGIHFSTWLYRVISNLAADQGRRRQVRRAVTLEEAPEPADAAPDALAMIMAEERAGALRRAIAGLPDRQREMIALTYGEGMSNAEVATLLDTTIEAVEAALSRARAALRQKLRAVGWMDEDSEDGQPQGTFRRSRSLRR